MAAFDMSVNNGSSAHPAPQRHDVSVVWLLFGVAAAPLAWIVQTSLNYAVASRACYPFATRHLYTATNGLWPVLFIATAVALAIGTAAAFAAWTAWRTVRTEHPGGAHQAMEIGEGRTRFTAAAGLMISGLFVAAVIFNAVGLFVVPPCG
jgi:hypothetical protein